ncbi:MAG: hypothetical protein HYV07_23635 [Deltaproteobacteria bacterium]|nr:hypothetical protein [Deltaproteobacteria bacterium]
MARVGSGDSIDYVALAARLRAVAEKRAARLDPQRGEALERGALPLDQVLRYLDTSSAAPLVARLTERASSLLAQAEAKRASDPSPEPFEVGLGARYLPSDKLERALVRGIVEMDAYARRVDQADVPRAVVTALAAAADEGGLLHEDQVLEALGPLGKKLLDAVRAGLESFRPGTERPKLKYEGLSYQVKRKVALSAGRTTFIERMPAFEKMTLELGASEALRGFTMASVQHLFPSTLALYDALAAAGLGRAATGVGGKNYSANPDVTARMQAEGWDVAHQAHPTPQSAGLDAEATVYEMARTELSRIFHGVDPSKEAERRFLILDDGGKLIKCLHEEFPEFVKLCVGVEQTDRGIQVIEEMAKAGTPLGCPVVNMARSDVKKRLEAPMIGEAVVTNAERELSRVSPKISIEPKVATVVGFGAIGQATAQALLRRGFEVYVTDRDPSAAARASKLGCQFVERAQALSKAQVLFSCTGHTTLRPSEYAMLPSGAVLVNAASGNHELGLHDVPPDFFERADPLAKLASDGRLRTTFRGKEVDSGDSLADAAMLNRVVRGDDGHEILVLRSGYVVNMTDGLPPEYVQLVLGLLYGSCIQAAREQRPGLVALDSGPAARLARDTSRALEKIGKKLEAPSFEGLPSWQL